MTDIFGLKIAPAGVEVTTAPEDQLSFISSRQILKVAGVGVANGPVAISHGFGYAPAFLVFSNTIIDGEPFVGSAGGGNNIYATTSDLVIPYSDMNFKYYVFYKSAI